MPRRTDTSPSTAALSKRERTRARILAAATRLFAARGPAGPTTRNVAAAAGISVGLAHYHFRSTDALLSAAIAESRTSFLGRMDATLREEAPAASLREMLEITRALVDLMPNWYRLNAEVDALGLRRRPMARRAAGFKLEGEANVAAYLERFAQRAGAQVPPGMPAALLAAFDGLAVRALLDPSFDVDGAYLAIEKMVLATMAPALSPPKSRWRIDALGARRAAKANAKRRRRKETTR